MKNLWTEILQMLKGSSKDVQIIDGDSKVGKTAVDELNLNKEFALAAVVCHTCGICIDNLIRVLGQDSSHVDGIKRLNFPNGERSIRIAGLFIAATDIFGGLFAINTEASDGALGNMYYFAPDTLEWEPLDVKYSEFLYWALYGDTDGFYSSMNWNGRDAMAKSVGFNQGILFYPFLWSKEINIETADKSIVPFEELININMEYRGKLFNNENIGRKNS